MRLCRVLQGAGRAGARFPAGLHRRLRDRGGIWRRRQAHAHANHHARRVPLRFPLLARRAWIEMKGMRVMRASYVALMVLALMSSRAAAAVIDWQAELQRCRALRESVAPLLQAGEGISAVGRSNRSIRRCIWIQRIAVRRKIPGAEVWWGSWLGSAAASHSVIASATKQSRRFPRSVSGLLGRDPNDD